MTALLPTRQAVSQAWEAYSKLCQAATDDPHLLSDTGYVGAKERAHKRWSEAFAKWGGR